MIRRDLEKELKLLLKEYPIVTILGPRQAGKTTLAKERLKGFEYCNLENPENRSFAIEDPKAFLRQFKKKVILDEIQRVPELLSYIQVIVDEEKTNGRFVLTGSHQLQLKEAITQSLAGRTAVLTLLPFSITELIAAGIKLDSFEDYALHGFLPRIYDQKQRPHTAYSNYYQTYVERDVRQLIALKDVSLFEKFMKLLAGRAGQIMDYQSLSGDVGVDAKTIKHWLSILEASFVIFKLPPFFNNFGKRVIKSPKYYFTDVGLLCFLLGLETKNQVSRDPLVGSIFENMVIMEFFKGKYNRGKVANLYFYRDSNGNEVDLLFQNAGTLSAVEVKSTSTYHPSLFKGPEHISAISDELVQKVLIYNGDQRIFSDGKLSLHFTRINNLFKNS